MLPCAGSIVYNKAQKLPSHSRPLRADSWIKLPGVGVCLPETLVAYPDNAG